jgi:hypothetical protein
MRYISLAIIHSCCREFAKPVDHLAVREQINRIQQSHSFSGKSQLRKLLEILFKYIDSQSTLKPELVVQELWPAETKTKRSADVATEINRLRNALESYYKAEGANDPILISLPNRSPSSADATHEKRWILALPRGDSGTSHSLPNISEAAPARRRFLIFAVTAAAIAFAIYFAFHAFANIHPQPRSGQIVGETLTIMDADGKELWSKPFPDGFQPEYYAKGLAPRTWFGDLDGDGHTDVLVLYQPAVDSRSHSTTLICYSDRGKEKWRWMPGRVLPELEGNPPTFVTTGLAVLNATNKSPRRIVLSSFHDPLYPDQIALLDSKGKTLSEYWHSGHLEHLTLADLDGDGKQEIVATGISNGYHEATLVVLDPEKVFGASTEAARPEIQIHGMGAANERLRLLFPRSDLNRTLSVYNEGEEPTISADRIRFSTRECQKYPGCVIWYEFDRTVHLLSVLADDGFRSAHSEFYVNRKDAHPFTPQEESEFRKVRCLSGCKSELVATHLR